MQNFITGVFLKFIYSEKATKFCEIFTSECMNFNDSSFCSGHLNLEIKFYQDHHYLILCIKDIYEKLSRHFLNQISFWKQKET